MDVHEVVPIHRIIDRAWPDYNYPVTLQDPHQQNYRTFLKAYVQDGGTVEPIVPGADNQIKLVNVRAQEYPSFSIRNLAANGRGWTGAGDTATEMFPPLTALKTEDYPSENKCSLALLLCWARSDIFQPAIWIMKPHTEDCHGEISNRRWPQLLVGLMWQWQTITAMQNACGPEWVRSLQAKAYVISAWDSAHPTIPSMDTMLSKDLYAHARDVYSTALKPENIIATKRLRELQSGNGHIVVRVAPSGSTFRIFVAANNDESDIVLKMAGPYHTGSRLEDDR